MAVKRKKRYHIDRRIAASIAAVIVLLGVVFGIMMAANPQVCAVTVPAVYAAKRLGEYSAKGCVVIDAGHGGIDCGTLGADVLEKDINLSVALKLRSALEKRGVRVILTRDGDEEVSLEDRVTIANARKADLFISLHCNYFEEDDSIAGLECYYQTGQEAGETFAETIVGAVGSDDRVQLRGARPEDYYVLRNTAVPAVLVEMGFLSNADECRKLTDENYQDILVENIAKGILRQLERG